MALSQREIADQGLRQGALTPEEYSSIIGSLDEKNVLLNKNSEKDLNLLEMGKAQGAISEEEYNNLKDRLNSKEYKHENFGEYKRGQSSLDITPEQIENYNTRRQSSLKKVEKLPNWLKTSLYPTGEEMASEAQTAAKGIRNIATLPGTLADLPMLPVNVGLLASGKQAYVPSQMIGSAIDTATSGYTKPESNMEKVNEAVMQSVLPMGLIGKGGNYLAQQSPKLLQKIGRFTEKANTLNPANVLATAGGSAAAQQYINQNPNMGTAESLLMPFIAGIGGSIPGGIAGKNLNLLTNTSKWAANKLDISKQKVQNQLKNPNGKYIPTTLADLSNSESLQMGQNLLEKLPFIGKRIKGARSQGLEAEVENLQNLGLKNALGGEGTGDLALSGIENYENQLIKNATENKAKLRHDLSKYAVPYEQPSHIITKEKAIVPNKTKHFENIEIKSPSQREKIEYYTGNNIEDMAKKPINLVPYENTKKFIGKEFSNVDHPLAQDALFSTEFGKFTDQLDNVAKTYQREGVPYQTLQSIRSNIDNAITTWGQTGKIAKEKLKQFRRAIHKDTSNYLESVDPDLRKRWDEANKTQHVFRKNELPIINQIRDVANKKTVEDVTTSLIQNLKDAGRKVYVVAKGLNEGKKELLGYSLINEMGQNAEGNFDLFATANKYKKIKGGGKRALQHLFSNEKSKDLDRTMRKIGDIQDTLNKANTSRSGYYSSYFKLLKNPIKAIGILAGALPGANLYSNKKFINWVSKGAEMTTDADLANHTQKLKKMNLGSNILNQEVRSLYQNLESLKKGKENEK